MKRNALNIYKGVNRHRLVSATEVYQQVAPMDPEYREEWVRVNVKGVLQRRYVRQRVEDAVQDLALKRMADNELDPMPWVHMHEDCPVSGMRAPEPHSEHDVFDPQLGFVRNIEAYQ